MFIGFLRGVPFFWTLKLLPHVLLVSALLLAIFYFLDRRSFRHDASRSLRTPDRREPVRIAGATRTEHRRNRMAGYSATGLDDLQHTVAAARAEIHLDRLACLQSFESRQMGGCEIVNVDVIANAGPIGRGIIVAKDCDLFSLAQDDLKH